MRRSAVVALALGAAGCGGPPPTSPGSTAGQPPYETASAWLCRPDLPLDACRGDLDATELRPDGTTAVIPFVPAASPSVDCFYVYPTVDMGMFPGNHGDFADLSRMNEVAKAQVARFGRVCRIFAPLYRQVTIGTYFAPAATREELLAIAFSDVLEAFRWYMAHAQATQKVVLVGHSQGAEMIIRLLRTFFDGDPAMREKLLLASSPERYILIDESKRVTKLGEKAPVPVEVIPEALQLVRSHLLEEFDVREIELRMAVAKDGPVITEHGNVIIEVKFADITSDLDVRLNCVPGVVGSGLFFGFHPSLISA